MGMWYSEQEPGDLQRRYEIISSADLAGNDICLKISRRQTSSTSSTWISFIFSKSLAPPHPSHQYHHEFEWLLLTALGFDLEPILQWPFHQTITLRSIASLRPTLDRILVQRVKPETKTTSGILLPSSVTEKNTPEATVLAVGPGGRDRDGKLIPMEVKAGDKVLLPSYGGQSIKVGDDEYHLFRDSEILAKFT
ncbi:hypothetical protein O181_033581 [Austropuccinia psidii MF-1]|uniref:10 kDa heat shock protein, mitochondrial n=1 Tax=Austropuccinia psidii MF-1 TaxID=1389203 RepID=A0A9Q3D4Q1_9BASI|nr:hypothetical protein [Austropuccinia psidii MF-1]